jgi:enoyl-CoA hydratase/carnithine racemase
VSDAVLLETVENGIARLVMNRPEKLNSLNSELATALNQAFDRIGIDE